MSGAAGLSAAKRRRAEQTPPVQQPKPQIQNTVAKSTTPAPRIMTPMLILEDHELRLRYIENCLKEGQYKSENNTNKLENKESSIRKDVIEVAHSSTSDEFKNKLEAILNRIDELENNNSNLLKTVDVLKSELSDMTNKHSNLQSFAMETNISLLKHKDTFEPAVFNRLMTFLLDKTTVGASGEPDTATREAVLTGNVVSSEITTKTVDNERENVVIDDKPLSVDSIEKKIEGVHEDTQLYSAETLLDTKSDSLTSVTSDSLQGIANIIEPLSSSALTSEMSLESVSESVSECVNEIVPVVHKSGSKRKYKLNV